MMMMMIMTIRMMIKDKREVISIAKIIKIMMIITVMAMKP